MPFALGLTLGNLGEGANGAEPDVVDPSPGLGDGGEQSVRSLLVCASSTPTYLVLIWSNP